VKILLDECVDRRLAKEISGHAPSLLKAAAIQAREAGTLQFIFLRSTIQTAPIDTALSEYTPYIPADSCAGIFPHPEAAI
jgi:hypothetical protein